MTNKYEKTIETTLAAFRRAVATGEGVHAAWLAHAKARANALAEQARIDADEVAAHRQPWLDAKAKAAEWNGQLNALRPALQTLGGAPDGRVLAAREELAKLNATINKESAKFPRPLERTAINDLTVIAEDLGVKPVPSTESEARKRRRQAKFGPLAFAPAYDEAVALAVGGE